MRTYPCKIHDDCEVYFRLSAPKAAMHVPEAKKSEKADTDNAKASEDGNYVAKKRVGKRTILVFHNRIVKK